MDVLLLSVTAVSLLVALIMSMAAWRLSRIERARSTARIAALAAAASEDAPDHRVSRPADPVSQESQDRPQEWRAAQPTEEWEPAVVNESAAPWAPAKVSTFRAESQGRRVLRPAVAESAPLGNGFLSSGVPSTRGGSRQRGLAIAASVLFVAIVTGGYWTLYGDTNKAVTAADTPATAAPLELISLRYERRGSSLSITGLVRNPSAGAQLEQLSAVVFLFDPEGGFVTSARAAVDFRKLAPGDESPFVITLAAPSNVARYRISFRNESGVVAHVDRRGQEPIARELP